jgi:hypothetical protein
MITFALMKPEVKALKHAINDLDKVTIGLFKHRVTKKTCRVLTNEGGLIGCVVLGDIGFHTLHTEAKEGNLIMFKTNLSDAMDEPFEFDKLLKKLED